MRTPVLSILTLLFCLLLVDMSAQKMRSRTVGNPTWDQSLVVKPTEAKFGDEVLPSYMITIYDVSDKEVSSFVKGYLKDRGAKVKGKGGVQADGAMMKDISKNPVMVRAAFEPGSDNSTHMHLAFLVDSVAVSPDDNPEAHEKIMPMMQKLSVEMNKAVVTHQIETHEKTLEDLQKDLQKLQKDNENLRKTISKNQKNIESAMQDISDAEAGLAGANTRMEVYSTKENPTTSDMKALDKIRKEIDKLTSKKAKAEQNITKYEADIQQAEAEIPHNEEEQERMKASIEEQQTVVEQYRAKKEAVN